MKQARETVHMSEPPFSIPSRGLIIHTYGASNGHDNMDSNQREAPTFRACASEY
jgi:hypothetical protein